MSVGRSFFIAGIGLLTTGLADPARCDVWFVAPDGTGDLPTIQAALDVAAPGDTVELGVGTFTGPGNRKLVVHQAVTIRCRSDSRSECVIDCESSSRAFSLHAPVTLEGLTIRNGRSLAFPDDPWFFGGGMVVLADAVIRDCVIESCEGDDSAIWGQGAGVYVLSGAPTFTDCTFRDNDFLFGTGDGGGLYAEYDTQVGLVRCTFSGNEAIHGGGLAAYESSVSVEDCSFTANRAVVGAGIYAATYGWPTSGPGTLVVRDSRITGNARNDVSGARGAGLHVAADVTAEVFSSTIAHNRGWYGGGLEVFGAATIESSILWGNCTMGVGEGAAVWVGAGGSVELSCSIVETAEVTGPGTIVFGSGNAAVDPLFCEPEPCSAAPTEAGIYDVDAASPALRLPECGAVGAVAAACGAVGAPATAARTEGLRLLVGPSPFAEATGIRWTTPVPARIEIAILDVAGRRVRTIGPLAGADSGRTAWDGTDASGRRLASGVYFVRLETDAGHAVRRVVLRR